MQFKTFIFLLLSVIVSSAKGQNQPLTEDDDNLYWQPIVEIDYAHFQSDSDADCIKYNEEYGLKMSVSIQLKGIVDIPKSHQSRNSKKWTGNDKLYLGPIFCKKCSCILSEDSLELVVYQLLFDAAEMCARGLRKELIETQQRMNISNVNAMFYATVKNKWEEIMRGTWASIYKDVLIQKKDSSYVEWRKLVDEMLEANIDFATQPYEIERLILGEPVEEGYVQAKTIMGDFRSDDEK